MTQAKRAPRAKSAIALGLAALCLGAVEAGAQVRFGANVRIGGHEFGHRRHRSVQVRRVDRLPGPPGCRFVRDGAYRRGDGSVVRGPMERCNLVAVPAHRR